MHPAYHFIHYATLTSLHVLGLLSKFSRGNLKAQKGLFYKHQITSYLNQVSKYVSDAKSPLRKRNFQAGRAQMSLYGPRKAQCHFAFKNSFQTLLDFLLKHFEFHDIMCIYNIIAITIYTQNKHLPQYIQFIGSRTSDSTNNFKP